jgi:hypothetical protein
MNHDSQAAEPIAEPLLSVNLTERQICKFWNKIRLIGALDDDCWEWSEQCHKGYGYFRFEGQILYTHRLSYFLTFGPFLQHLRICHKCDNPPCCNPSHLFLGTDSDNFLDMHQKGRRVAARGEKAGCAKLTDAKVIEIRALYAKGGISTREVGLKYGVSFEAIRRIVNRTAWQHVT